MKIDMKKQIPDMPVYLSLYAVIFGISIWLLVFHKENPTNWILYVMMSVSLLPALVKVTLHTRKKHQQSA